MPDNDARLEAAKQRHRQGEIDAADAVYRDILRDDPWHAGAQHMIGVVFLQRGRASEAEQCFRLAIGQDGRQADFHSHLGIALGALERPAEALECHLRAIELDPGHEAALSNASTALLAAGRHDEAQRLCRRLLEIEPSNVDARLNLAATLVAQHRSGEALPVLVEGLERQPEHVALLLQKASALEMLNRLDEAAETVDRLEGLQAGDPRVALLSGLVAWRRGEHELAVRRLKEALDKGLNAPEAIEAHNQLGLALDALGRAEQAFASFERCNRALASLVGGHRADGSGYRREIESIRAFFTQDRLRDLQARFGDDELEPVFFVGFPRSGTTLMEQVLKAHPALATTDERSPLTAVLREIETRHGGYPGALDRLDTEEVAQLRSLFRDFCRQEIGLPEGSRVVDKLPLNIVHAALARLLFPRAKILVALRDPRDACLSCFMQKFELNAAMANFLDLETTGRTYDAVMGLWLHYRGLLRDGWLEYRYEDLVDDFDGTVRRVLDFIGVGWHENVAGYRRAAVERSIATPSYRDVTEPLNRKAVERWREYQPLLETIAPRLSPYLRAFGYPD